MSAAEKLRTLADSATQPCSKEKLGAGLFLVDALPQIVAVVEAAEELRAAERMRDVQSLVQAGRMIDAALAALEEALT